MSIRPTITKLSDTSPMPFGIYKGKPMSDVPASYLHYLWRNRENSRGQCLEVIDYIKRNLDALIMENDDLIWD